jgi:hypothetical protein
MDMSLVLSALAMQSGNLQTSIATQIASNNARAEKEVVQALLGAGTGSSQANLPAGVGTQLDIAA